MLRKYLIMEVQIQGSNGRILLILLTHYWVIFGHKLQIVICFVQKNRAQLKYDILATNK